MPKQLIDFNMNRQLVADTMIRKVLPAVHKRKPMSINGWNIQEDMKMPVTGRWIAIRFGIRIGASTYESLVNMIKNRGH